MDDTSPAARARYVELLREVPAATRARIACALSSATRALAVAGLRERHPGATPDQLDVLLAERLWGSETARRLERALAGRRER